MSNVAKIAELFPSVITESVDADGMPVKSIDFDLLRQELSDYVVEGPQERYHLDWPGKRAASFAANAPVAKTLRPVRDESVSFDSTKNLFIEGDSLDALKLLQESYLGKVKLIYIDPPYNTGNDFVYADDFAESTVDYLRRSGQSEAGGTRLVSNAESNGRFHSDWLTMMYPRLRLARNLLTEDGSIFVSINDVEVAQLRKLLDETFGPSNFIAQLVVKTSGGRQDSRHFAASHEYVLVYARSSHSFRAGRLEKEAVGFNKIEDETGRRYKTQLLRKWGDNSLRTDRPNLYYAIQDPDGRDYFPMASSESQGCWRWSEERMRDAQQAGLVEWSKASGAWVPYEKVYEPADGETLTRPYGSLVEAGGSGTAAIQELFGSKVFSYPKSVELLELLLAMANVQDEDVVLDFFAGSGTTAHAVLALNAKDGGCRQFALVQLGESIDPGSTAGLAGYDSISQLSRERLRRAGAAICEGAGLTCEGLDIGFRSFKVDSTNMSDVLRTPDNTDQQELAGLEGSVKPGRSSEDLLFQVLLEWGLEATLPVAVQPIDGFEVFVVDDGALVACFDEGVTPDLVRTLAKGEPLRAVFRDSGFASDDARINAEQVFKEFSPSTDVKAI